MTLIKSLLFVFLGGGFGSVLRFGLSKWLNPLFPSFYLGTFTVNILGSLLIGLLSGYVLRMNYLDHWLGLLLITGFCGGFTTFSTFSLENYNLIRSGDLNGFMLYTALSLVTGIGAVIIGIWLSKSF